MPDGHIEFQKLVRDKIPENLEKKEISFSSHTLSDEEFQKELLKKIIEEATEVAMADSREERIRELADLEEVLGTLRIREHITLQEVAQAQQETYEKKGGFENKTFLEWTEDDGYVPTK